MTADHTNGPADPVGPKPEPSQPEDAQPSSESAARSENPAAAPDPPQAPGAPRWPRRHYRRVSDAVRRNARQAPSGLVSRYEQAERALFRTVDLDEDLPSSVEARQEHLSAMRAFHNTDEATWQLQDWLHMNLTVLDYKAQSTLSFSGIAIAAFTFVAAKFTPGTSLVIRIAVAVALFLLTWSAARLSKFNFVVWSSTDDFCNPDQLVDDLLTVRNERTRIIRACWARNLIALLLLLFVLLYDLFFAN
jgi:hypothetical protein